MPDILNQPMQQAQRKRKPLQPGMPAMGGKQMPTAPTTGIAPSGAPPMPGPMPSPMGAGGGPASAQAAPQAAPLGAPPVSSGITKSPRGQYGAGGYGDVRGATGAAGGGAGAQGGELGGLSFGGKPTPGPAQQSPEDMWGSILEDYNATLPEQLRLAEMEGARQSRRMTELAPGAGGVGGAWGGAAAQGALGTSRLKMEAQTGHQKRGIEMKMAWLEMMIERAEAENNRDLARQLRAMQDETLMAMYGPEGVPIDEADWQTDTGGITTKRPSDAEGETSDFWLY